MKNHLRSVDGEYPVTARILVDCLYVDDLVTGAQNEEALEIYAKANAIFNAVFTKLHEQARTARK